MSYLAYLINIIVNLVIVALGFVASIGVPWAMLEKLKTFHLGGEGVPLNSPNAMHSRIRSINYFWDAALGCLTAFCSTGYVGCAYYFWVKLDSVMEAVFLGTITIIGITAGVAIAALGVIHFGREADWII